MRSAVCRRLAASALAVLGAVALQPPLVGQAGLDDTANPSCPLFTGIPGDTGKVLSFDGNLQCFRPGGERFGNNVAPANQQVRDTANPVPPIGEPCKDIFHYPVRFTEDGGGGENAVFQFAGGQTGGSFPIGSQYFTADDATVIGFTDFFVTDEKLGSYELANPADPNSEHTCQLDPTYHFFCPSTNQDDQFCFSHVPWAIKGSSTPPQDVGPLFRQAIGNIGGGAGVIGSAPSQLGVVNSPVCFWIDGMGIPDTKQLTLHLAGPVDSSGRQVFYTLLATIQFTGVSWQFEPGSHGSDTVPVPGDCPNHPEMTAHQYTQISAAQPGGQYRVTATENYSISVQMWVADDSGLHGPMPVDSGLNDPTLSPDPYLQTVVQVEGIPIGG